MIPNQQNKFENLPAANSAQAQPEKGMRLCAERYGKGYYICIR